MELDFFSKMNRERRFRSCQSWEHRQEGGKTGHRCCEVDMLLRRKTENFAFHHGWKPSQVHSISSKAWKDFFNISNCAKLLFGSTIIEWVGVVGGGLTENDFPEIQTIFNKFLKALNRNFENEVGKERAC